MVVVLRQRAPGRAQGSSGASRTHLTSRARPSRGSSIVYGKDIHVDELRKHVHGFFPDVEGWKEHIKAPIPWFDTAGVVYQITGRDKTGKSFFSSYILAQRSQRSSVVFVTTERSAQLVAAHLLDLGANLDNVVFIDYSDNPHGALGRASMGKGADPFYQTPFYRDIKQVYETLSGPKPWLLVVDSLTGFFEAAEWSGRLLTENLARTIFNLPGVLAFAISQKRTSHSEFNTEVAGGLTVSHILDGTFILAKYRYSVFKKERRFISDLASKYGGAIHTLRWDGCRWGPHPESEFIVEFSDNRIRIAGELSPEVLDQYYRTLYNNNPT